MVIGNQDDFAIEYCVKDVFDNWILGNFRFWVAGEGVGDWEDLADLKGCQYWLCNFVKSPQQRFEPELKDLGKGKIFELLFDSFMPVMVDLDKETTPLFKNIESRFHIAHLGMSAFDHYDILLIETPEWQRILWRDAHDMIIKEAYLSPGKIQSVAYQFCLHNLLQETSTP